MFVIMVISVVIKIYVLNKDRCEFCESINLAVEVAKFFFYSDFGQEYYSHRGHFGEVSFVILFGFRNFRGVNNCGLEMVYSEMIRTSIKYDLKKILKHVCIYVLKKDFYMKLRV